MVGLFKHIKSPKILTLNQKFFTSKCTLPQLIPLFSSLLLVQPTSKDEMLESIQSVEGSFSSTINLLIDLISTSLKLPCHHDDVVMGGDEDGGDDSDNGDERNYRFKNNLG